MKKLLIALALALASTTALAQTPTPVFGPPQLTWDAPIATNVSQCVAPAAHSASICPVEVTPGAISYYFWNGSGWTVGGQGTIGPAGPTGATGPQGPPGPAGPAGAPATNPVTSVNGKTGAVVLTVQ